jgi:arabinofuranosyltransferase
MLSGDDRRMRVRLFGAVLASGLLVTMGALLYDGDSSGDDSFIYMRYVANALGGKGFTFNPGETGFGVTGPLWSFLMAGIASLFGNSILVWKVTSAVLLGLKASALLWFLTRFNLGVWGTVILASVGTLEPHSFRWGATGMENSLAGLALVLAAITYYNFAVQPNKVLAVALGVLLGVMPFARPELVVLSVVLWTCLLFMGVRELSVASAATVLTVSLMAFLTYRAFGALVPQTAEAKAIFLRQDLPYYGFWTTLKIVLSGSLGCLILLIATRIYSKQMKALRMGVFATLLVAIVYLSYQNQLVSTRYASYLNVPIVLAAVIAVAETVQARGRWRTFEGLLLAMQAVAALAVLWFVFPVTRTNEAEEIRQIANVVKARTHEGQDARVALTEVGAFGFYSNLYIIDLVGLTDKATLKWAQVNGPPKDIAELERLLIFRGATYYIDSYAQELVNGRQLNFVPVAEGLVRRANYTRGFVGLDTWRVYQLTGRGAKGAPLLPKPSTPSQ